MASAHDLSNDIRNLKILLPVYAVGPLIGKHGANITALKRVTGTQIRLSESYEKYKGSVSRVCEVKGNEDGILAVVNFLLEKMYESMEYKMRNRQSPLFIRLSDLNNPTIYYDKIIISVTDMHAGAIIGTKGASVKKIHLDTGARITVSSKDGPKDRFVTISGNTNQIQKALQIIFVLIGETDRNRGIYEPPNDQKILNTHGVNISLYVGVQPSDKAFNKITLKRFEKDLINYGYPNMAKDEVCYLLGKLAQHGTLVLVSNRN